MFEEIVSNIIRHGYTDSHEKHRIWVTVAVDSGWPSLLGRLAPLMNENSAPIPNRSFEEGRFVILAHRAYVPN